MKLASKTNVYFLWVSLVIFFIGGVLFYLLFQVVIDDDIDLKLHERKSYNLKQLERSDSIVLFQKYSGNLLRITPIEKENIKGELVSDTLIFDPVEGRSIGYRQLTFNASIHQKTYSIQIRRRLVEQDSLIRGVVGLEALLFLTLVAVLTLMSSTIFKRIWKPFYSIVSEIKNYQVESAGNITMPSSSIDEFRILADAIERMSDKIHQEFNAQKEFTENASHEIQTPLAIATSKLDMLLQFPDISSEQMELISSANAAIARVSKLNEALMILSKIENRQFHEVADISVNDVIDHHLAKFNELLVMKNITVKKLYSDLLLIKMNIYLAEILFGNLIINAIMHNVNPGKIEITTTAQTLQISNTGVDVQGNGERFFQRFAKVNKLSPSLGLGLSIVKGICDTYQFHVSYSVEHKIHRIEIKFW